VVAWRHSGNTETKKAKQPVDGTHQKSAGKLPIREGHVTREESIRLGVVGASRKGVHPYLVPVLVFFVSGLLCARLDVTVSGRTFKVVY
jgi:hypothetical protein